MMLATETTIPANRIENCGEFRSLFDTQPFVIRHHLARHPLFTNEALHRLASQAGRGEGRPHRRRFLREVRTPGYLAVKGRGIRWGSPEFEETVDEAFADFANCNLRLKITAVNEFDGYREFLQECTREFSELTGVDFERHYGSGMATLFIASPHEATPYHIDEEVNFLLQLRGTKEALIFDGDDRTVVTERDLEQFWFGRCFIDQRPGSRSRAFHLAEGDGLFNPAFFPHLMTSGERPSVSLSLAYQRLRYPEAEVHRMNAYLRKCGLRPSSPGRHPAVDKLKSRLLRNALAFKRSALGGA